MLVLHCYDNLPEVGRGYVCVVAPRMLRHVTTESTVTALRAVGMAPRDINGQGFYDILASLSIPRSELKTNADYSRR
ncbi:MULTISPECIES: hypothetical protein [unclassified Frigoribacterium]|jgi:hypothetical protein|uniref:hypothetical protein n=1 Tax=unclassified Frigoribacterium TaxID=2627005 RepID=UPI0006F85B24|nr:MULTISPECIES: hypothetical protein [unclassified Frigoribacterium]KQM25578.1 hypothetical protein ASL10_08560 [Frigoribacterium sp. Leaf8]MBD8139241.1 hypothetical protein [Frigoribacterium sp. CFBP 13605]MBD8485056.1 hypothetical protein [Frigoribacterium sp. CFBP 8759]WAC51021.1 hypothetical protein OVA02_14330 [Frigoribacterium sp. SL97]